MYCIEKCVIPRELPFGLSRIHGVMGESRYHGGGNRRFGEWLLCDPPMLGCDWLSFLQRLVCPTVGGR